MIASREKELLLEVGESEDPMSHFVRRAIEAGNVGAFYMGDSWYDVGTTEAYEKLENRMIERHLHFLK